MAEAVARGGAGTPDELPPLAPPAATSGLLEVFRRRYLQIGRAHV